jgi:hypothetical protein
MFDTHPDVAIPFRDLMMSKTGEQRLLMGCSMFETAKKIVLSSICNRKPGISDAEIRREIFLRFYGLDFSEADKDKVLSALSSQ